MTQSIYARALGESFEELHPRMRERYGLTPEARRAMVGRGRLEYVETGSGLSRLALAASARLDLLFPERGVDVPVEIRNYAYRHPSGADAVSWLRRFETTPPRRFDAVMVYDEDRGCIVDYLGRGGHVATELSLSVDDGGLSIRSGDQWLTGRGLTVPIPGPLRANATVREEYDDGIDAFRIDVDVHNPIVGHVFGYHGTFDIDWIPVESVPSRFRPKVPHA